MRFISDPSLPGHGIITGVFFNQDRSVIAVASAFDLLTNPPARASYGGQTLRYRVALYRPPNAKPFAVFDHLLYPANDVGFHPYEPAVVIATGRYDGGWAFEGELIVWDWGVGRYSNEIGPIPEVVRSRFCDDGSCIIAHVRPWDEDASDGQRDPFDTFYEIRAAYSADLYEGVFNSGSIAQQISNQHPLSAKEVDYDPRHLGGVEKLESALRQEFGLAEFKARSAIWDVAWLGDSEIGIVHDDCQLEILDPDGRTKSKFVGPGHGVQIFRHPTPLVHVAHQDEAAESWPDSFGSQLLRYDGVELGAVVDFEGRYTFSVSQDGWILGRRDRSFKMAGGGMDVIGDPGLMDWSKHNLGHYDVFNHFLRVDGAPYLFAIQGKPPSSHERKHFCLVSTEGSVRQLWPILRDTGDYSSHAMECAFGYVADSAGEGIIASGRHHSPDPRQPYTGFIYRKQLQDGKEIWRHETKASATAIKAISGHEVILVAFLNGDVAAIESSSGTILQWSEFRPGGELSVIFSFDISAKNIVVGTVDGRVGIQPISEFLESGINS